MPSVALRKSRRLSFWIYLIRGLSELLANWISTARIEHPKFVRQYLVIPMNSVGTFPEKARQFEKRRTFNYNRDWAIILRHWNRKVTIEFSTFYSSINVFYSFQLDRESKWDRVDYFRMHVCAFCHSVMCVYMLEMIVRTVNRIWTIYCCIRTLTSRQRCPFWFIWEGREFQTNRYLPQQKPETTKHNLRQKENVARW